MSGDFEPRRPSILFKAPAAFGSAKYFPSSSRPLSEAAVKAPAKTSFGRSLLASAGGAAPSPKPSGRAGGKAAAKGEISDAIAEKWIGRLRRDKKKLSAKNFPSILKEGVCRYLSRLGRQPAAISPMQEQALFKEVFKIYGQVLDHTLEHNYFYCLYSYFGFPGHPKIMEFGQMALPPKKREALLDRLETCHREETEGNGDSPPPGGFHGAALETSKKPRRGADSLKLLSLASYKKMPYWMRRQYSNSLRRAYLALEGGSRGAVQTASAGRLNQALPFLKALLFPFYPLPAEAALKGVSYCLMGGVYRKAVLRGGKYVCTSHNNPCAGYKDGFKCGAVFGEKCIPRLPWDTISERCHEAAKGEAIPLDEYESFKSGARSDIDAYCSVRERWDSCGRYLERIDQLDRHFSEKIEIAEKKTLAQTEILTEGQAQCSECAEGAETADQTAAALAQFSEQTADKSLSMTNYLSDTVFDLTSCAECHPGNDLCTRGCGKENDDTPGVSDCIEGKDDKGNRIYPPRTKSQDSCMAFVNSSIMRTIHEFIGKHCLNYPFDRNECVAVADGEKPAPKEESGIPFCGKGFVFPSALCALNLDGGDRYDQIKDTKPKPYRHVDKRTGKVEMRMTTPVLKRCQDWAKGNQELTTVSIPDGQGGLKTVPLFQKVEMPDDPEDLPEGSIVVMNTRSRHGHVEIKTNKKECGGGRRCLFLQRSLRLPQGRL